MTYWKTPDEMMAEIDEINQQIHNGLKGKEITVSGIAETIFKAGTNSGKFAETTTNDVADAANSFVMSVPSARKGFSTTAGVKSATQKNYFQSLINLQVNIEDTATPYALLKACAATWLVRHLQSLRW